MTVKIYNKLVRDNIPLIIAAEGKHATTKILNSSAYHQALCAKLQEECQEFLESKTVEELADIAEVVLALARSIGSSSTELEQTRQQKAKTKGAFARKIYLEQVADNEI